MHPILRIFPYQTLASLAVLGSCDPYHTTVGILGSVDTCNIIGCLTVQISAFDVLGIGECYENECVEDESCQHIKYAFNCIYHLLPNITRSGDQTKSTGWTACADAYQMLPDFTRGSIWLDPAHRRPLPIHLRLHGLGLNTHIMDKHEQAKWDRITQWTLRLIIALMLVVAYLVVTGRIDTLIS